MDSDGEWEPEEEPPELVAARAKLAQFDARPGEEEPPELTKARAAAAADAGGADATIETREWQSLGGGAVDSGSRCGAGPGGCESPSCADCGPTEGARRAGRAAEEEVGGGAKENTEPDEVNIEPLDVRFGNSVSIVKHTEEALDELD
jgi:hypothetical protein